MELIRFILETYPEAARCLDDGDLTPLHHATVCLAKSETVDISIPKICSLLIEAYPKAVSLPGSDGVTPLRTLLKRYGNPKIQPILVAMLRIIYPKPVPDDDRFRTFLQRINGLLKDEAKHSQNCVNINRVQAMLQKKLADDQPPSPSSADALTGEADDKSSTSAEILQIYSLWASDNRKTATARIQSFRNVDIPKAMQDFQFQDGDDDDDSDGSDHFLYASSTSATGSDEEAVIDLLESSSDGEEENVS